jgi:RsiW-degrading membrane proteinase PrsW (M82 family)
MVVVNGAPAGDGRLGYGEQFRLGSSVWQVMRDQPRPAAGFDNALDAAKAGLNQFAGTSDLRGFSLVHLFSEVFKRRTPEEVEEYFVVGTSRTTPHLSQIPPGWPKPWFFLRVLLFVALCYLGLNFAAQQFSNQRMIPGMLVMGALAVPLATVILLFELNAPRNVSFYFVLMLVFSGGVVSLILSLFGFAYTDLDWLGASSAGIVEEIGKLLTVALLVRQQRYRFILNGLLFGAAVGAGFAFLESAGYAFDEVIKYRALAPAIANIELRAMLAPFGHVAWTAIAAAALWRVKGAGPMSPRLFTEVSFLRAFLLPVLFHMLWNSPLPSFLYLKHLAIGAASWFVVFTFAQQGLRQVRAEQTRAPGW